jgi:hypothetical protein
MKYNIPDQFMGKPLKEWMKKEPVKTPAQPTSLNPNLESKIDSWKISGVNYRNGVYVVDLAKELLPAKTQDEHAQHREQAKGDFYTADMPLYHALFTSLYNQKNNPQTEEIRAFIQKSMRANWLMTLTRIAYQPKGNDKIIHNCNTKEQYELQENIVGPDRKIVKEDSSALKALLGTDNIDEIKEVYNYINKTPTYIWRVNSKQKNVVERIARFNADSGRALLGCYRYPDYSNSALGVRASRTK